MQSLSFFTPLTYTTTSTKSIRESLVENIDSYFYLKGKKAYVIGTSKDSRTKVVLCDTSSSLLVRIAKVISYFTLVIPLVMLLAKAVLRSHQHFKVIDAKAKLTKGCTVTEDTLSKIEALMPKIIARQEDDHIEWFKSNNLIFKINEMPNCVFKLAPATPYANQKRFANMIKAKEVCLAHQLDLLVVPCATMKTIRYGQNTFDLIIEQALDLNPDDTIQEDLYHRHSKELNKTVRQLTTFVANTGFNDVTWRNIPLINEEIDFQGDRRVGLIDLEAMESVMNGLTGDINKSCGLIRCVSKEQLEIVSAEACKQGIALTNLELNSAKRSRLEELESNEKLSLFYQNKSIVTGQEPLEIDLESLGLDLTEEGQASVYVKVRDNQGKVIDLKDEQQTVTLKECTEAVIKEINTLLIRSSPTKSLKGKRYLHLNTHKQPLLQYANIFNYQTINQNSTKKYWLDLIIQALIDKNHIHRLVQENGHGYFIQA